MSPKVRVGSIARKKSVALCAELFDLHGIPERPLPLISGQAVARSVLYLAVVVIGGTHAAVLAGYPGVSGGLAAALGVAVAVPILLASRRPMLAWWMSLGAMLASSLAGESIGHDQAQWPWTASAVCAQILVAAYVAYYLRPAVVAATWVITVLLGALVVRNAPEDPDRTWGTLPVVLLVTATVMIVIVALRGRTDARRELAVQSDLTSTERDRRTLLEERARIARELHDVVAHHMSVIAIQAEAAPYRVADPPPELVTSFATIRTNAVDALAELRRVLGLLRAEGETGGEVDGQGRLAPQPTLARLPDLIENVRAAGMAVETVAVGTPRRLSPGVDVSAYRIAQEALSNALRHAPGARVRVELAYVPTGVGLRVHNEPPPQAASPAREGSGHGVLGMRERAGMIGGTLKAGPTAEGGFEVDVFLPSADQPDPDSDCDARPAEGPPIKEL